MEPPPIPPPLSIFSPIQSLSLICVFGGLYLAIPRHSWESLGSSTKSLKIRYQGRFISLLAYAWVPLGRFRRDFSGWGTGMVAEHLDGQRRDASKRGHRTLNQRVLVGDISKSGQKSRASCTNDKATCHGETRILATFGILAFLNRLLMFSISPPLPPGLSIAEPSVKIWIERWLSRTISMRSVVWFWVEILGVSVFYVHRRWKARGFQFGCIV